MTISEVCEKLDLTQDTMRYYERIGLIPKVERNAGGFRVYTEQDCQRIMIIKLMRTAGMSIEQLTQYIAMARTGNDTLETRKTLLYELRDRLVERIDALQATLQLLEKRLEVYELSTDSSEAELFLHK